MRSWVTAAALVAAGVMVSAQSTPVMIILNDGTRLTGSVGANLIGAGSFSATGGGITCSGKYNAWNMATLISAPFKCTDGRSGMVAAQRDDMMGMAGRGIMTFNDGDTALFAFGVSIARLVATAPKPPAKAAETATKAPERAMPPADTSPPEFPLDPTGKAAPEVTVALENNGGTFTVPVFINKSVEVKFFVDSGAADISLPTDVATTLMRNDALADGDIYGEKTYSIANGSTTKATVIILRELNVGGVKLKNVVASVGGENAPLLLGQSFLSRFSSWSLDNDRHVLVLKAGNKPTPAVAPAAPAPAAAANSAPKT